MSNTTVIQCIYCGDSCGESVCYGCQDTLDMAGIDSSLFEDML